ncbi:hypothetical protein ACFVZC_20235 [Streptomyces marokkonensis]|uniref:Uncharacterized protein n=1 Tax=Streptomyces marokkonensis TaxID=324855 RepID=A0ABW6Q921_9ACTN
MYYRADHPFLTVTATYGDDNWAPLRELPGGNATSSQLWYLTAS